MGQQRFEVRHEAQDGVRLTEVLVYDDLLRPWRLRKRPDIYRAWRRRGEVPRRTALRWALRRETRYPALREQDIKAVGCYLADKYGVSLTSG